MRKWLFFVRFTLAVLQSPHRLCAQFPAAHNYKADRMLDMGIFARHPVHSVSAA